MTTVEEHLWHLGVGHRLKGYRMTVLAVNLALEDETRLQCAQNELYKPISVELGCDFRSVERDIRTVIDHAWRTNPEYLSQLAGFPLSYQPTVIQFLDILVAYSLRELDCSPA